MIFVQFMWGLCGLQKLNFPLKMSFSSYADFLVRHFENIKPTFEWIWSKKSIKIGFWFILCFVFLQKQLKILKFTVFAKKQSEKLIKIKIDPILIHCSHRFSQKQFLTVFANKRSEKWIKIWFWLIFRFVFLQFLFFFHIIFFILQFYLLILVNKDKWPWYVF